MAQINDDDRELLTAYLDGELDESASHALEDRLGKDGELRAELNAMRQTWGMLDFLPKAAASPDFTNRTIDRLSMEGRTTVTSSLRRAWPRRRVMTWGAASFAALALGFGGSFGYRHYLAKPIDPDEAIVRELRLLERYRELETIDDLGFLKALDHPDLFGEEGT